MFGDTAVPLAQKKQTTKKGDIKVDLSKWSQKVVEGVEAMIESGRVKEKSHSDLRRCADLLQADPQPFLWDTAIYKRKRDRGAIQTVQMENDDVDVQDMPEQNDDEPPN